MVPIGHRPAAHAGGCACGARDRCVPGVSGCADRLIVLEFRATREARIVGSLQSSLRRARSEVRGRAIAARAAADAAEGAAGGLAAYVRDGFAIGGQVRTVEPEQLLLFAAAG